MGYTQRELLRSSSLRSSRSSVSNESLMGAHAPTLNHILPTAATSWTSHVAVTTSCLSPRCPPSPIATEAPIMNSNGLHNPPNMPAPMQPTTSRLGSEKPVSTRQLRPRFYHPSSPESLDGTASSCYRGSHRRGGQPPPILREPALWVVGDKGAG